MAAVPGLNESNSINSNQKSQDISSTKEVDLEPTHSKENPYFSPSNRNVEMKQDGSSSGLQNPGSSLRIQQDGSSSGLENPDSSLKIQQDVNSLRIQHNGSSSGIHHDGSSSGIHHDGSSSGINHDGSSSGLQNPVSSSGLKKNGNKSRINSGFQNDGSKSRINSGLRNEGSNSRINSRFQNELMNRSKSLNSTPIPNRAKHPLLDQHRILKVTQKYIFSLIGAFSLMHGLR